MNMVTPMELEMEITFGTVFTDLCIWISNLRISSYPDKDIFLAFMDISSCFLFPRIFPDLVRAYGFIVGPIFYAANAGVSGSVASASSWGPFQVAITALAAAYFFFPDLVAKHDWLLQKLHWSDASSPPGSTTIVRARPCTRHKGVFDSAGRHIPTKHKIYVNDNLLAEVKAYMHQALASGFEATFTIMGHPCPSVRPVPVNLDKLEELVVSPLHILLPPWPYSKHTRVTVSISDEFCREVLALLTATWHCRRESFMVKELELLVGKLGRIAQAYCPFYFFMSHIYSSLAFALRENQAFLINTSKCFFALIKKNCVAADEREINFALSQSAKKVHSCPTKYRIPPSL